VNQHGLNASDELRLGLGGRIQGQACRQLSINKCVWSRLVSRGAFFSALATAGFDLQQLPQMRLERSQCGVAGVARSGIQNLARRLIEQVVP
jgi:hypothetical protein